MIELLDKTLKAGYMEKVKNLLMLLRVSHWTKASFVLLGFVYSPVPGYLMPAVWAALSFCLISSAVYIYNDIEDKSEDMLHPHKCQRPLASDKVSVFDAIILLFVLLISGFALGCYVSKELGVILCCYLLVNVAYNHLFKLIPVLDVLCIAMGFMLRVLAGTVGIGLSLSSWLIVAATLLSLFIALNKRRLEMQLGLKHSTRKVLKKYNPIVLNWLIVGIGIVCFVTYLFYTVYARDESFYFMVTLPFAAFALWRFTWLSAQDVSNDDPVNVFLSDRLSRINLYCFVILTYMAIK